MISKGGSVPRRDVPALILSVAPCGEHNAFVHLLTKEFGVIHGVAYGATSRKGRGLWIPGNVIEAFLKKSKYSASQQVRGELLFGCIYTIMHSPILVLMLQSVCVLCDEGSFPEDVCPALFDKTLHFLSFLGQLNEKSWTLAVPEYVAWEREFLRLSGFGLDLDQCAVTGCKENLAYVSPRTGRAVTSEGAGKWKDRLFALPAFMVDQTCSSRPDDWLEALRITGHFLKRDVFSQKNMSVPSVRARLLKLLRRKALAM